ncbi:lasso peptide isopeptide bond-forming cyclase [Chlorogloeopsis sp. ULAP01]|uniref:lasso peptide isopeptide bond-forming cyclase n=1 Tax=Chlorogloeopsis sp. ULAP01 TaxID=3056483 RepID=UPI0025AA4E85|nr:lasso peptide isopeptide bond-forming cyclase [Chlorogloeopsis sp. ULAP01]MDM9379608.1 lasso peptide isopeptide bond-forming cyclase [Chlorogloeopsis sp. ULAP01]
MSGIVGVYYLDGQSVDHQKLGQMVDIIAHRGPDNAGIWIDGCVGLGHRMLWTTPESLLEKLPYHTGDLTITADARIDNRDELICALELNDYPAEKVTDSQLILAAYEKWGKQCPEHLLGDFAFAIWDRRKQILFCARDHFGVKPFYYYSSAQAFVFGSEIKAIFCLPDVPRQINEVRIGDYLVSMFEDTTITFYQDILRLPPAHRMIVSCEGIKLESYWSLNPNHELRLGSDEEYAAKFRELFSEAVRCRMRSAYPLGTMLSGGLDSSSITCTARKILEEEGGSVLPTFSAIFDKVSECDERAYINPVLAQGGMKPHYVCADQISPLIDSLFKHLDEPLFAFNLYLNRSIYKVAQQQGVRIILDGFDGDSTVSHGVSYLNELAINKRWFSLIQQLKGFAKNFNYSFWQLLWQYLWKYEFEPIIRKYKPLRIGQRVWQALQRRVMRTSGSANQPTWSTILNPDFVERVGLKERRKSLNKLFLYSQENQRAQHYYSLARGVMPYTLEVLDKAAAEFGIELRFPFWDKRLVEFCLSVPGEQKIHQGWTRMVMRRGMAGILPQEVQWRGGKSNLAPSFNHGLLTFEQERLEELLVKNSELIKEYTNTISLHEAYHRFISQQDKEDDSFNLWKALNLALWLKHSDFSPSEAPQVRD